MSKFETISFDNDIRGVATITLARAGSHNAINNTMVAELSNVAKLLSTDSPARVCVLQAQGKTFCAGGDLVFMQSQMALDREEKVNEAHKLINMLTALDDLPCPLVAKVQGSVYGGGIGLLACCDLIVSAETAEYSMKETMLGLIPAAIGPFVVRRIGEAWARQYFFSARTFTAVTALKMNLVTHVASSDELEAIVENEISQLLKCQPEAVRDAKAFAKQLARNPSMETGKISAELFADRLDSDEAKHAIRTFLAR
ncbi:MAG: enoyl-CoA hydratase [Hyphomicrobiales bacterium]|nr:enoyl-CoA hydratase [Hyphomicrobiales bacterium]